MTKLLISFLLLITLNTVLTENIHKRFEYKYSFKGPYLAQKNNQVPFWVYSGSAIASEDNFRITTSLRSQKGQAWGTQITDFEWWEIEVVFRVNGGRQGADGLALWFTQTRGVEGPVFGSSDQWAGLGIFFDSFDNDNKRNNPYVMGVVNDGTKTFNHDSDGIGQQLGGCIRDYRNKPFPVRAKIVYFRNVLTVQINNGMTKEVKDYEICFTAENVHLPNSGYFGITAATGGLADDHDVSKFLVYSYRSQEEMSHLINDKDGDDKFNQEFDQYQEKTLKAKNEYMASHPEATTKHFENEYETTEQKDLYQIFQGQGVIFEIVKELKTKIDSLVAKQETTLSVVSSLQAVGGGQVAVPQVPPGATGGFADGIRRHEVDAVFNNQRELLQSSKDIKSFVTDIHQKSQQLLAHSQVPQGTAQQIGGQYDYHATVKEINEGLNIIKRDLGKANLKLGASPGGAGVCPSCVSTGILIGMMMVQLFVLLGYFMYRDSKEAKAKKFY